MKRILWVAMVVTSTLATFAAEPEGGAVSVPTTGEVLAKLSRSHPRLLASREDFAQLNNLVKSDPQLKAWRAALRKRAEQIIQQPPSEYKIPDGLRLLETSRRVVNRVYTLALLYRLDGKPEYAQRAWRELEAAAHFQDWNPRHFLDTAEMTHAFAIGYDWLYDIWTPEQRTMLQKAIVQKGFTPGLKKNDPYTWWTKARHNWNQVCNGGLGMGALALGDVEPEVSGEILRQALESLPLAMGEFAPDGAWAEGPGYWNYATSYNIIFLAALRTALGTDFGLSDLQGFSETGLFPLYLTGPLDRTFNYADGGDGAIRAPQMFWLAQRFHQPVFAQYERRLATPAALDLVWGAAENEKTRGYDLPLDKYFRGAEVATLRSAWDDPKALYVAFKAGDNKANHSHLDLGSFVLDALGLRWAVDLGADDYNLPYYFGKERWHYYRLRAEGHNTLVINPGVHPDQDPAAAARIVRFESKPDRAFAIADLSAAYKKDARKVWRGLALRNRSEVLIQDEVQTKAPAEIWWFLHTPAAIEIRSEGRTALLEQKGQQLRAEILAPGKATFESMEAQPLATSPHPERQARNEKVRKLAIHLTAATDCKLVVRLAPVGASGPNAREEFKLLNLSDW